MKYSIESLVQYGSLLDTGELQKCIGRIDARIARRKKDLEKPNARSEQFKDEIHRLNIFRNEFESLKNSLRTGKN
jgi:hypothetical protein